MKTSITLIKLIIWVFITFLISASIIGNFYLWKESQKDKSHWFDFPDQILDQLPI